MKDCQFSVAEVDRLTIGQAGAVTCGAQLVVLGAVARVGYRFDHPFWDGLRAAQPELTG